MHTRQSLAGNTPMKKAVAWLEARSRWGQLRVLGNSDLVKASVLMPAFGYMLLLNDNVHYYLTIKYDGLLLNYLPSIWRIWLLFYGSFLVAIGSILYMAFCPAEVKRYASAFEMADAEQEHQERLGQVSQVRDNAVRLYANLSERERAILPFNVAHLKAILEGSPIPPLLVVHWTFANISRQALRIAILLLFSVGLVLIAVPAAFTFVQVTLLGARRLLG
jgi:hypothetical protein